MVERFLNATQPSAVWNFAAILTRLRTIKSTYMTLKRRNSGGNLRLVCLFIHLYKSHMHDDTLLESVHRALVTVAAIGVCLSLALE
jgi:hypothetical protein